MAIDDSQLRQPIPPEEFENLTGEAAHFIFDQAEALLLDAIEVRRSVESKANTLIATLTPTVFALFSVITGIVKTDNSLEGTYSAAIIASFFLILAILLCIFIVNPTYRQRIGSLPKDLFEKDWGEAYQDRQVVVYLINEINSYQRRADYNLVRARRQAHLLQGAVIMMFVAPTMSGALLIFYAAFPSAA